MNKEQQIVLAVLVALLEDKKVGEFWHTMDRRRQQALKLRMEAAIREVTTYGTPTTPAS
jgi:hypothetical protein